MNEPVECDDGDRLEAGRDDASDFDELFCRQADENDDAFKISDREWYTSIQACRREQEISSNVLPWPFIVAFIVCPMLFLEFLFGPGIIAFLAWITVLPLGIIAIAAGLFGRWWMRIASCAAIVIQAIVCYYYPWWTNVIASGVCFAGTMLLVEVLDLHTRTRVGRFVLTTSFCLSALLGIYFAAAMVLTSERIDRLHSLADHAEQYPDGDTNLNHECKVLSNSWFDVPWHWPELARGRVRLLRALQRNVAIYPNFEAEDAGAIEFVRTLKSLTGNDPVGREAQILLNLLRE